MQANGNGDNPQDVDFNNLVSGMLRREIDALPEVPHITPDQIGEMREIMTNLFQHTCTICGLPGHKAPYCWYTAMMYQATRGN